MSESWADTEAAPPPCACDGTRCDWTRRLSLCGVPGAGDAIVAIKVIDKQCIASQEEWTRFHTELQVLQRLRHPLIVELFEVVSSEQHFCIAQQNVTVRRAARGAFSRPAISLERGAWAGFWILTHRLLRL